MRLGPWLLGPALGLLGAGLVALVGRVPPGPPEPWYERARQVQPVRQVVAAVRLLWLVLALLAAGLPAFAAPSPWRWPVTLAAAWLPPLLVALGVEARLQARPLAAVARSWAALSVAAYAHAYLLALVAGFARTPASAAVAAGVAGAGALAATLGGNLALAQALGLARPAGPEVAASVQRAAARAGVRVRAVLELAVAQANAFAVPLGGQVVFTRGAVASLAPAELEAVAAHELGHLGEPGWVQGARLLGAAVPAASLLGVPVLAELLGPGGRRGPEVLAGLAGTALALLLVVLLVRRARRAGEAHADLQARDPEGVYAGALEAVYRSNLVPAVLRTPGPHGHLYDRLAAAGQPPAWPRPAPPPRPPLRARLLVVLGALLAVAPPLLARGEATGSPAAALASLALGDDSGWTLEVLGRHAADEGRREEGLAWYRAAEALLPGEPFLAAARALVLVHLGRCREAVEALAPVSGEVRLGPDARRARDLAWLELERCREGAASDVPAR